MKSLLTEKVRMQPEWDFFQTRAPSDGVPGLLDAVLASPPSCNRIVYTRKLNFLLFYARQNNISLISYFFQNSFPPYFSTIRGHPFLIIFRSVHCGRGGGVIISGVRFLDQKNNDPDQIGRSCRTHHFIYLCSLLTGKEEFWRKTE